MNEFILSDLHRVCPGDFTVRKLIMGLRNQGFRYMFFRRVVKDSESPKIIKFLAKLCLRRYTYKYGFQIGGKIGKGFYIGHFGAIVISDKATIGQNCNVAHNVTIGATRGPAGGAPTIKDRVWIGAGAVVVGNVVIEEDVLIAPNSFVNFDVPSNSIVIGNPGEIRAKVNPTKYHINNIWG